MLQADVFELPERLAEPEPEGPFERDNVSRRCRRLDAFTGVGECELDLQRDQPPQALVLRAMNCSSSRA